MSKAVVVLGLAMAVLVAAGSQALAANVRLILVESPSCGYCIKWDREVGPSYPKSKEGRFAPLKRVQRGDAALKGLNPVIYTPTFIVVRNGEEVGRVTGYSGKLYFWDELDQQLAKAGFNPGWGLPPPTQGAAETHLPMIAAVAPSENAGSDARD